MTSWPELSVPTFVSAPSVRCENSASHSLPFRNCRSASRIEPVCGSRLAPSLLWEQGNPVNENLRARLKEIDRQIAEKEAAYRAEIKRLKKTRKGIATALGRLNLSVRGVVPRGGVVMVKTRDSAGRGPSVDRSSGYPQTLRSQLRLPPPLPTGRPVFSERTGPHPWRWQILFPPHRGL